MSRSAPKIRVHINCSADTKATVDSILEYEWEQDRVNDRPKRSKSEILKMILRKGAKTWPEARVT
jgi:hypothetical protein